MATETEASSPRDLEKHLPNTTTTTTTRVEDLPIADTSVPLDEIERTHDIQTHAGFFRGLRRAEEWLDSKVGIETQGIDRIPEEAKQPPSVWNTFLMWWSLLVHVGILPVGVLGPEFGLSLGQTVAASVTGIVLGSLCPAFTGTLGPKTGLRQIAASRYSFGFYGAKLCSLLNVVIGGGFYVVNLVVVGQILSAVSDFTMSITVGIVIISVVSYVLSVFGFRLIHSFEKYSWIGGLILLCVLIGQAAPYVDPSIPSLDGDSGLALAGPFLSILAINFSNVSAWCSIASDYYCNFPASTPPWKVFWLTFWGNVIPATFTVTVGACLGNIAISGEVPPFADAYENYGLGGLIAAVYHPSGWSKFALVLLTFTVLGNNIVVLYSSGLSLQLLGNYFHAIPRFIWSIAFAIVVGVLAIAGQQNLSTVVSNFVSLLGYWTISFTFIVLLEDQVFRRREGYNLKVWDRPADLPLGSAAVVSLLAGYLAGGLTGMSQVWYIGPIAAMFGGAGGDVGIYLAGAITLVVYPVLRTIERKYSLR